MFSDPHFMLITEGDQSHLRIMQVGVNSCETVRHTTNVVRRITL